MRLGDWKTAMVLEMLKLRARSADCGETVRELLEAIRDRETPAGLKAQRLFNSAIHPNELVLFLEWEEPGPEPEGSVLARSLAYRLKKLGMVERSMWQTAHSDPAYTSGINPGGDSPGPENR